MDKINVLIKYGELTLKGKNVQVFKDNLARNVRTALQGFEFELHVKYSRIYLTINNDDFDEIKVILENVYGIHSFAVYVDCDNDIEKIKDITLECVKNLKYSTFKVETKRKNKQFPVNSVEVSRDVGGFLNAKTNMTVDVHDPELIVSLEIRNHKTLIYFNEYQGCKGLPVGVSGKGLLMLSGGIDSPIAGYLINKRGVKFDAIHFTSPPYTMQQSVDKVIDLCDVLHKTNGDFKLFLVKFTKVQEELLNIKRDSYFITIMRRIMYRVAMRLAEEKKYKIVVNGDNIGQVASQTLSSMNVVDDVCTIPVIRPLATYDKAEIIEIAQRIDTYSTSILDFEDCCTTFVPKSPVINPKIEICKKIESYLPIIELIEECIDSIEVIEISKNKNVFQEML